MSDTLRIIPLGGVGEVGKNITVLEVAGEILVVDCGLAFPDPEMLEIDLVIPDATYLADQCDPAHGGSRAGKAARAQAAGRDPAPRHRTRPGVRHRSVPDHAVPSEP